MSQQEPIKVLHFSSRYEECGVAKYLTHYLNGMTEEPDIRNEYFEVSPYETHNMKPEDLDRMASKLKDELKNYDVLHIQHEFGLYAHDSFMRIVEAGKQSGKKVVITVHISPNQHGASKTVRLKGLGPHSLMQYLRLYRHHRYFIRSQMEPFRMADLLLVHNDPTIESMKRFGVSSDRIIKTPHPVQVFDAPQPSNLIATKLHKQEGDVIYCSVGFLHRYKGLNDAVRALKFLPDNYKLAILGGMKEDSDEIGFYNKLADLIEVLNLQDRVYITGFVKGDDKLNALIRECDICVYPFDKLYYADVSSGSLNLAFANNRPAIAYPTATIKEMNKLSEGALILCETFAYYELARELLQIDIQKQSELSEKYAKKMAWAEVSKELANIYRELVYGKNGS